MGILCVGGAGGKSPRGGRTGAWSGVPRVPVRHAERARGRGTGLAARSAAGGAQWGGAVARAIVEPGRARVLGDAPHDVSTTAPGTARSISVGGRTSVRRIKALGADLAAHDIDPRHAQHQSPWGLV